MLPKTLRKQLDKFHAIAFAGALAAMWASGDPAWLTLSGKVGPDAYVKHEDDWKFVCGMICILVVARTLVQRLLLAPLGAAVGLKPQFARKWMEAGWFGVYYGIAVAWELTVFPREGWLLDPRQWWVGYPHVESSFNLKLFYLGFMLAFWLHAVVVLFVERPRADFVQMLSHHILTISMVSCSYYVNFLRVGASLMIEQDVADGLLYFVKMANYLGKSGSAAFETASNVGFALFALVWAVTRHGLFFVIYASIVNDMPNLVPHCWDHETGCLNAWWLRPVYLVALAVFQGLMMFWFSLIAKLIYKVATSDGAKVEDTRSDDEDSDDDEDEAAVGKKKKRQ